MLFPRPARGQTNPPLGETQEIKRDSGIGDDAGVVWQLKRDERIFHHRDTKKSKNQIFKKKNFNSRTTIIKTSTTAAAKKTILLRRHQARPRRTAAMHLFNIV
jgi:hypothetical protein